MPAVKKEKHDSKKSKVEIGSQEKVKEAINALKLLEEKFVEKDLKKKPLLENGDESLIFLQIILKKIPPPQLLKMVVVSLPHSLITETSEICLITGDLEKHNHKAEVEPTVLHYEDLLKKHGVTNVAQVIPLRQLRTEYKTFESRRQLAAAYDVFLIDKKIAGVVPKILGKSFFQGRKFPIQIDMRRLNLKDQINKALCQTKFSLTCRGNSYALEIARLSMEKDAILENIMASIEVLANKLPGKENNILSLYLKTAKSKAIPIYLSLGISNISIKKPPKSESVGIDELSTIDDAKVKVFRDGRVILIKNKKNTCTEDAAEDYVNTHLNEPFSEEIPMENEEDTPEYTADDVSLKKKKRNSKKSRDLIEIADKAELPNQECTQDYVADETSSKKKKKDKKSICLDQVTASTQVENEEFQDSITTETSSKKKKKGKKSICLDQVTASMQVENEEFQDSTTTETSSKKKKKGKKSICLDQVTVSSQVENEDIQDSITTEISTKKRKKERKSIIDISDNKVVFQNAPACNVSSKKKNKKNTRSSLVEAGEAFEDARVNSTLLNFKKQKIHKSDKEKMQKFKNKDRKFSENEDNGEIEKNLRSHKSISEVAEEDFNVKTPKSKKEKKSKGVIDAAKKETSFTFIEDKETMQNEKTSSRLKKVKKESTEFDISLNTSSMLKRKKANDVKDNLESSKHRRSINIPMKA